MPNPSELTDHLGYRLRQVSNHVSQSFARRLEVEGVTVAEWVLMRVVLEGATAPSRVAQTMGFTRGAVTKLADRLIARDIMVREADAEDGRARKLALTAKGRRLTPKLAALADQNEAECFGHLSDGDRRLFRQILEDAVARFALDATPVD